MHLTIRPDLCSGHGRCYAVAPELIEPDDEGFASPRGVAIEIGADQLDLAQAAADACPEQAIEVHA